MWGVMFEEKHTFLGWLKRVMKRNIETYIGGPKFVWQASLYTFDIFRITFPHKEFPSRLKGGIWRPIGPVLSFLDHHSGNGQWWGHGSICLLGRNVCDEVHCQTGLAFARLLSVALAPNGFNNLGPSEVFSYELIFI